ncbi:MAG: Rpn family recombination-promoting nuclease/putative transposase [Oscillatoria sp. PMC 1068.18]|nr:Rpn family recombination-promoting nuclease/putative transposase [Oscillatoria sp. PMC 1076.18]MEC4990209.1 Rpn family recombination-promoting nuclease/putative transposase [Oscillatoria sp. PMC 1068.18]
MTKPADIGSKRLISLNPDAWAKWVTQIPDVQARQILSSEFQWISRESDVLVQAYSPSDGEFLLLNELQLRYQVQMPKRMLAYTALAIEKYNLPVYPVLINIIPPSRNIEIVNRYESQFRGLQTCQDYRVINLWEVDAEIVFQESLTSLIPFVPVLRGGGEETIVREALQILRADEKLSELENLLAFFATFVLDSQLVQQIMRWDMAVLRESPWYQQILQEGRQEGRLEGRQEGRLEGRQEGRLEGQLEERQLRIQGLISGISLSLELKFGNDGLALIPEIMSIENVELLSAILAAVKTVNSPDELRQIYQRN